MPGFGRAPVNLQSGCLPNRSFTPKLPGGSGTEHDESPVWAHIDFNAQWSKDVGRQVPG